MQQIEPHASSTAAKTARRMRPRRDSGFTLIALLVVVAIISIIAAIAIPGLLRARMTGHEASAIATLRVTTSSEIAYAATCGGGAFADSYPVLATPPAGGVPFVPAELSVAVPVKSGFRFTLEESTAVEGEGLTDCNGTPAVAGFYATAVPVGPGSTGARAFAVNTEMTIWQNVDATAAPTEAQMSGPPGGGVSPISPIQ